MKILFIGGFGRSGSTLLDVVLGQYDRIFNIGELRHIWQRGLVNNELCGCGKGLLECDLWNRILHDAFPDIKERKEKILSLAESVDKPKYLGKLILRYDKDFNAKRKEYVEVLRKVYSSIFKITGAEVVVDSSKTPSHGYLLADLKDQFDVRFLHLVRNPKAVAYSWKKKKLRPEIQGKREFMPRYGVLKSAVWWNGANLFSEILKLYIPKNMLLRYEDFTDNPRGKVNQILDFLDYKPKEDVFSGDFSLFVEKTHTVAGNPSRFKTGEIKISTDEEWKKNLKWNEKLLVDLLTFPLAKKYGY